ncbi:hypothetical protein BDK51DRAFT_6033, partial [Blyttiomyces helicus]
KRVAVTQITRSVTDAHVKEIFNLFGVVTEVLIPVRPQSTPSHPINRGIAYVEFETRQDAEKAIEAMEGGWIDGVKVKVVWAE